MERQVNAVDADAVEKLIFLGEGFHRRIPGQGQHIFFALNQAAGTIFLTGIGAGAAIAGVQRSVTFGKDVVDVLFHRPGRAHPPARHLPDNHVSPEKILHLFFDIVFALGADDLNIMPGVAQITIRDLGQGVVQLAVRVGEFFRTVDNQNVAHFLSSTFQFCESCYPVGQSGKMSKMCKVFCFFSNNSATSECALRIRRPGRC